MKIRIKKLHPDAVIPFKAHSTDAGFDLTAVDKVRLDDDGNMVYRTGLAFEIPKGWCGLVFPRSSIAKKDLLLSNSIGVIDSDYRGEVLLKFKMVEPLKHEAYHIYEVGERIGQIVFMPVPEIELEESDELSETERGTGGYGSSGR